jgi:hypothetical protein
MLHSFISEWETKDEEFGFFAAQRLSKSVLIFQFKGNFTNNEKQRQA